MNLIDLADVYIKAGTGKLTTYDFNGNCTKSLRTGTNGQWQQTNKELKRYLK